MSILEKLWVVVPYYRGEDSIGRLLTGLDCAWDEGLHVVIVDNSPEASFGVSARRLDAYQDTFERLHVLRAPPGIGFGRACNLGATFAVTLGASHVMLLNQDAVLAGTALKRLWETACEHPGALIAPVEVIPGTTQIHPTYARWYLEGLLPNDTSFDAAELPETAQPRETLGGMCIVVPRQVIDNIGLFDPIYKMYGEDGDFCRRAGNASVTMLIETRARLEHEHSNVSATGIQRAKIVTWIRESRAIVKLREQDSSLLRAIVSVAARRILERLYDGVRLADWRRVRLGFESDLRLAKQAEGFLRARRGEPARERMMRTVEHDLARTSVR